MTFLRDLSIRWKVIHIIMVTMTVALLIACATFMTYDYITFRDQQIKDSQALGDLFGRSSTAALSFDDAKAVRDALTALSDKTAITRVHVYTIDGTLFASDHRAGVDVKSVPAVRASLDGDVTVTDDRIGVFRPNTRDERDHRRVVIDDEDGRAWQRWCGHSPRNRPTGFRSST